MIRKGFYYKVKPGKIEEYTRAHNPIPEELKEIMKRHGFHNYSIFHHAETGTLFGYVELESEEEAAKVATYECARKWWKHMTEFLVCDHPDDVKARSDEMDQVFYME